MSDCQKWSNRTAVLCRIECRLGVAELMRWEAMVMKESLVGRDPVMEGLESCGQTHGSHGQPPQRMQSFKT